MRIVKRAVDVCMTVLLLCLMAYQVTGETLHEWLGIGMTVLLIVHHILNRKWNAALFKGKYNAYRIVSTAVNALLFVSIGSIKTLSSFLLHLPGRSGGSSTTCPQT